VGHPASQLLYGLRMEPGSETTSRNRIVNDVSPSDKAVRRRWSVLLRYWLFLVAFTRHDSLRHKSATIVDMGGTLILIAIVILVFSIAKQCDPVLDYFLLPTSLHRRFNVSKERAQFTIRDILLLTFKVAILCAIFAPYLVRLVIH